MNQMMTMPGTDPESAGMDEGALAVQMSQMSTDELAMLQERVVEAQQAALEKRNQILDALSITISKRRSEAITAREQSGIEQEWEEDEESYEGIDDANRVEEGRNRTIKPLVGASVPVKDKNARSTVFLNVTRPFVDAASARVSDMLLPTDDRAWDFKATPIGDAPAQQEPKPLAVADAEAAEQGQMPQGQSPMLQNMGMQQPQMGQAMEQGLPQAPPEGNQGLEQVEQAGQGGLPQGLPQAQQPPTPEEQAKALAEKAAKDEAEDRQRRVVKGRSQVEDWQTESNWPGHMRRVFDDSARIGSGVMKSPFPIQRRRTKWIGEDLTEFFEIVPDCRRIDPWNFYPDGACGESIHNGRYCFERDDLTAKTLQDLTNDESFFADQIELALDEGPTKHTTRGRIQQQQYGKDKDQPFESWIFYGNIEREDLEAIGCNCPPGKSIQVPVLVQMVNDRIVKIAPNPLDSGRFPYDVMPWSVRKGLPWGRGVSRQCRTPQRMVNAATRNMMDNAGIAAGLILFLRRRGLTTSDNNWELHGRKIFWVDDTESASKAAKDAFATVDVPIRVNELMAIINFALSMAERVTGMPMLLQGQQGDAPDTVGGMTMLNNNASGVMRRIARAFDDYITEPAITRYYEWLQQYTDDREMRFDAVIDARGSSALVERDLQNQWIAQMSNFVLNPAFRIDPAKWFSEFSKSVRFDPARIQYSDSEWEKIQSKPPPKDPRVEAAEIARATKMEAIGAEGQSRAAEAQARGEASLRVAQLEQDAETARTQARLATEREVAIIQLLSEEKLSREEIRARLLSMVTTSRDKRDLFAAEAQIKAKHGEGI